MHYRLALLTLFCLGGCDKFEGAMLDADRYGKEMIQNLSVSQSQRDAETSCAASVNSGRPRPNGAGEPVNYHTVNPPQFKTRVIGYDKYDVQTLLDVPRAATPFVASCIVERGKVTRLVSD